jgi:hypothetical protein
MMTQLLDSASLLILEPLSAHNNLTLRSFPSAMPTPKYEAGRLWRAWEELR